MAVAEIATRAGSAMAPIYRLIGTRAATTSDATGRTGTVLARALDQEACFGRQPWERLISGARHAVTRTHDEVSTSAKVYGKLPEPHECLRRALRQEGWTCGAT